MPSESAGRFSRLGRLVAVASALGATALLWRVGWPWIVEEQLLRQLDALAVESPTTVATWAPVAHRLIERRSRRAIPPILRHTFQAGPAVGASGLVDSLRERFGSRTVWRESRAVFRDVILGSDEAALDGALWHFWLEYPESPELARFAGELFASARARTFAAALVPYALAMPEDRRIDVLLALLRDTDAGVREAAAAAAQRFPLGERRREVIEAIANQKYGGQPSLWNLRPSSVTLEELLADPAVMALWELVDFCADAPTKDRGLRGVLDRRDALLRDAGRPGGWLECYLDRLDFETDIVAIEPLLLAMVEQGLPEERLVALYDAEIGRRESARKGNELVPFLLHDPSSWFEALAATRGHAAFARLIDGMSMEPEVLAGGVHGAEYHPAARALGRYRGAVFEERLLSAWSDDRSRYWKEGALLALGWMRARSAAARARLERGLDEPEIAWAAVIASRWIAPELPIARRVLGVAGPPVNVLEWDHREALVELVGPESAADVEWLAAALRRDPRPELVLRALERIGPAAAPAAARVGEFIAVGGDPPAPPARLAALRAIASIDGVFTDLVSRLTDLARTVHDDEELFPLAVDALAGLGPPARDALLDLGALNLPHQNRSALDHWLIDLAVADPWMAARLPSRLDWLRGWLAGTPRDRSEAVAYARRRLLPSLEFAFPGWHSAEDIDEILAVPDLSRELGPVWRILAAAEEPELTARGLYGRWLAGEGLDVDALREELRHALLVGSRGIDHEGSIREYLRAIERVGPAAAELRREVEEIRDTTRNLAVLDAARRALVAIERASP